MLKRAEVVVVVVEGGVGGGDVLSNCGVLRGFMSPDSGAIMHSACTFCAQTSALSSQRGHVRH